MTWARPRAHRVARRRFIVGMAAVIGALALFWVSPFTAGPASPASVRLSAGPGDVGGLASGRPGTAGDVASSPGANNPSASPAGAPVGGTRLPTATGPSRSTVVAPTIVGSGRGSGADVGAPSATASMQAALSARLTLLRSRLALPGVSAAILFSDGSIWLGTAGDGNVRTGVPVTSDTPFAAASVSKTFTSALILSLVDEGRLSLAASVRSILPGLAIDPRITIRELLDHTSGLADFYRGKGIDAALQHDRGKTWTAADALAYVGKPLFTPGTAYSYSNTNYLLLGLVAEAVADEPIGIQLQDRFLGPLGLTDTVYQGAERPAIEPAHAYRVGGTAGHPTFADLSDGSWMTPFTSVVTAGGAAASIATTPRDLVRWARALYGGDVLSATMRQAMLADAATTARLRWGVPYGLGVQLETIGGVPTIGHSGRLLGSRAAVRWLPDDGMAIAVMTNQSRIDPIVVVRDLLAIARVARSDCGNCPAAR